MPAGFQTPKPRVFPTPMRWVMECRGQPQETMLGMPGSAKVTRCSVSSTQVGSPPIQRFFRTPSLSGRLALEFKGNIATTEADFLEHAGDPGIIQIQRVPIRLLQNRFWPARRRLEGLFVPAWGRVLRGKFPVSIKAPSHGESMAGGP